MHSINVKVFIIVKNQDYYLLFKGASQISGQHVTDVKAHKCVMESQPNPRFQLMCVRDIVHTTQHVEQFPC